jgi:hypothetical protein
MTITTARELAQRLNDTFDPDKPILIDTGDGIFTINGVSEDSTEIIVYLDKMP